MHTLYHTFMKNIRLWTFLFLIVCIEAVLLSLVVWQHSRMLEKIGLEKNNNIEIQNTNLTLKPDNAIFLLHQKQGEKSAWRYFVPTLENNTWLDLGILDPQRDKLNPDFTNYRETKYVGKVVQLETPKRRGWLKSPFETAHPRVWSRLDETQIGPTYLAAKTLLYPTITPYISHVLSAKKHKQYRNTWAFLAFILLIFCAFFVKSIKSKNS